MWRAGNSSLLGNSLANLCSSFSNLLGVLFTVSLGKGLGFVVRVQDPVYLGSLFVNRSFSFLWTLAAVILYMVVNHKLKPTSGV